MNLIIDMNYVFKYRPTSLYAVFLSANLRMWVWKLAVLRNLSHNLYISLVFLYANSLYASLIFWSLSLAYNEVHLYMYFVNFYELHKYWILLIFLCGIEYFGSRCLLFETIIYKFHMHNFQFISLISLVWLIQMYSKLHRVW